MCNTCTMLPIVGDSDSMNIALGGGGGDSSKAREMRLCAVCGDVTERRHLNYGGEACFSCRAFFRRIHQKAAPPAFECKQGGGCAVNPSTRRRCQKCRYDRCIMAGMRPECVMDEQQRRNRSTKVTGTGRSKKNAAASQQHMSARRGSRHSADIISDSVSSTPSPPSSVAAAIQVRPPSFLLQTVADSDHSGSSTPINQTSTSPSPPATPPRPAVSFMRPGAHLFHLQQRMDPQQEYRMRMHEGQQMQMMHEHKQRMMRQQQLQQQQQQQEYSRRHLHPQSHMYRTHPYLLPYRRPSPHPPTPSPPPVAMVEEALGGHMAVGRPEQFMQQQQALSPTPSPTSESHYPHHPIQQQQQQHRRQSIPPSDCVLIKSLLNQDDAVEPIPAGFLFTPANASKTPDPNETMEVKKEEEEDVSSLAKPFSKKRMILERMEKEAQEKSSSVVATHLKTSTQESETTSSDMGRARKKLDYLRESWAMAVNQMGVTAELRRTLIALHRGGGGDLEAKQAMRANIFALTRVFRKFALQQEDFRSLSDRDQQNLVLRNSPIFVQYVFARYCTARRDSDKADWMLLEDAGGYVGDAGGEAESFTALSDRTGIFPRANREDMFRYEALLRSLDEPRLNQTHIYLMARACLFHLGRSQDDDRFEEEGRIRAAHQDSLAFFEAAEMGLPRREEVAHLLLRLDEAVGFFRRHADFFGGPGQNVADVLDFTYALAMPPSQEERDWLDKQLGLVQSIGSLVPYNSEQVAELIRFCYLGQDISVRNSVDILAANLERSGFLLRSHPEFQSLSEEDKLTLERSNGLKAVALGHARLEVCGSAESALDWLLGDKSHHILEQIRRTLGACGTPFEPTRRICMREFAAGKYLSAEEITRFERLSARLAPALRDERVFPVALLLVLFSGSHRLSSPDSRRAVAELQRRYIATLKRALCAAGDEDSAASLDSMLLDVNRCLNELADIAMKYYSRIHDGLCSSC